MYKTKKATTISHEDVEEEDMSYIIQSLKNEFSVLSGNNILITGGAGFLGYYFVKSFIKWNSLKKSSSKISVTILDNFSRGMPEWISKIKKDAHLNLIKNDITEPIKFSKHFDYIIHAASIASPIYYRKNPIQTMDANVSGLRNLLDFSLKQKENGKKLKGFLFFSTSEIYGDPDPSNIPTKEDYRGNVSCTGPRACYDESKRFGETLCVTFANQFKLPIKIVRPFNNYGPGLKITDGRVISDLIKNVINEEDIELYSDGSPTRTFCYISDAIIGYIKVLVHGDNGQSYNIGTSKPEISILDLSKKIKRISKKELNYEGKVTMKENLDKNYLTDNPNRRAPDISKAKKEVKYSPKVSLDEGLKKSIIWYSYNNYGDNL